jgi:hypothetical protein
MPEMKSCLKENSWQQKLVHCILEEIQPFSFMKNIMTTTSTIQAGIYLSILKFHI